MLKTTQYRLNVTWTTANGQHSYQKTYGTVNALARAARSYLADGAALAVEVWRQVGGEWSHDGYASRRALTKLHNMGAI